MNKSLAIASLALLLTATSASAETTYKVKTIADGDTITVTAANGTQTKVRFACVDVAEVAHTKRERSQPTTAESNQFKWGNAAKNRLTQLLKQSNNQVTLRITDTDRYGRKVAEVRLKYGVLVQQVLALEGLAMVYTKYLSSCPSAGIVQQAEAQAKQRRSGVWGDKSFVAPSKFRQR